MTDQGREARLAIIGFMHARPAPRGFYMAEDQFWLTEEVAPYLSEAGLTWDEFYTIMRSKELREWWLRSWGEIYALDDRLEE